MSRKSSGKKIAPVLWYHCEICNVHITTNDRERHEKVCPLDAEHTGTALEYIRHEVLYTTSLECRKFEVAELKDLPTRLVNNMIFLSEGAMRLANFRIGQHVIMKSLDRPDVVPIVRSIWPVSEKFLTTVFLSDSDFAQCSNDFKGGILSIYKLEGNDACPAEVVRLKLLLDTCSSFSERQMRDVERLLKQTMRRFIYSKGSIINMNFFNKPLQFKVSHWKEFEFKDIENDFLKLSINEEKEQFFSIGNVTRIEVEHQHSLKSKQEVQFVTTADIGGLDKEIQLVQDTIDLALGFKAVPQGLQVSRGMLLYGPPGCGKSLLCEAMATYTRQHCSQQALVQIVSTSELFSKYLGETEKNLKSYFEKAYEHFPQPSLIIIEDLDNICPRNEKNELLRRVSYAFLNMIDDLTYRIEAKRTLLLATTSNIELLNTSVRRYGRLDNELEISVPTPGDRLKILQVILSKVKHDLTDSFVGELSKITHAYVGADLASLISTAYLEAFKASKKSLNREHLEHALTLVKPSAMREILIENPNVHWSDIGGQDELKAQLKQSIEWPMLYPEKFKYFGIRPPRGLLMFGPPGCSKTMVAKALATESGLNFLSIKGPELFSMWVGESERAVREVFRKARQVAPSIVFFDEIDALSGERGEGGTGSSGSSVKERVLTQLLTELDGVEELQNVTVVAATNRPDMIDKALLRPGRIDRIVYVPLPNDDSRQQIFSIRLQKMPIADDVEIKWLVESTVGYSGAEICAVCQEAALHALTVNLNSEFVTAADFKHALALVTPRTSPELLQIYEKYIQKV